MVDLIPLVKVYWSALFYRLDKNHDGECNDAIEAYISLTADANNNVDYGIGNLPTVIINDTVTVATYLSPADANLN
jgi:hypothetical protein